MRDVREAGRELGKGEGSRKGVGRGGKRQPKYQEISGRRFQQPVIQPFCWGGQRDTSLPLPGNKASFLNFQIHTTYA